MTTRLKDNSIKALVYVALLLALLFKNFFPLPATSETKAHRDTPQLIVP